MNFRLMLGVTMMASPFAWMLFCIAEQHGWGNAIATFMVGGAIAAAILAGAWLVVDGWLS